MSDIALTHDAERPEHQFAGAPDQAHGFESHEAAHPDGAHDADEHGGHHHGPSFLHHHFINLAQQRESTALGMWAFLSTEVMMFGALFFVYTLYHHLFAVAAHGQGYVSPFAAGSHLLNHTLGFGNTLVLLVSSLTMAGAVYAAGMKNKGAMVALMGITWILGLTFLCVKAVEWTADYNEGIVPGLNWNPAHTLEEHGYGVATNTGTNAEAYLSGEKGEHGTVNPMQMQMYFVIYFCMTGLHAIHMIIGLLILGMYIVCGGKWGIFTNGNDQPVEIFGLYWHFVDIVWVFLYPLLYLIAH